jgi:hypothetical protein
MPVHDGLVKLPGNRKGFDLYNWELKDNVRLTDDYVANHDTREPVPVIHRADCADVKRPGHQQGNKVPLTRLEVRRLWNDELAHRTSGMLAYEFCAHCLCRRFRNGPMPDGSADPERLAAAAARRAQRMAIRG